MKFESSTRAGRPIRLLSAALNQKIKKLFSAANDRTTRSIGQAMHTKQKYYRVDRRKIAFIKFIIEAYDGIAAMRTIDPQKGIVLFYIAPGCERHFEDILHDLSKQIRIQPQKASSGTSAVSILHR